jgi:hypothetical protein
MFSIQIVLIQPVLGFASSLTPYFAAKILALTHNPLLIVLSEFPGVVSACELYVDAIFLSP